MEQVLLSVIIPVYNTISYLRTCLDSICMQTIPNIEIIVIDDASKDDIHSLINEYEKKHKIIYRKLSKQSGPGGARNVGIDISTGKYIGFCDSDDWVDYNYYTLAVNYMESHGADIGMCTQVREYDYCPSEKIYKCKYDDFLQLTSDVAFRTMTYQYQNGIKIIPPCINKIYRSDFIKKHNFRFENSMYFQDVYFCCQTLLNANKIICIPQVEYHHYKRENSIIQSYDQKHTDDFSKLFTLIRDYLKANNLYEKYCYNYYKFLEHFYNIIIREIFEFIKNDNERKQQIAYSFRKVKPLINFDEYLQFTTAEELREHIQPQIHDTTLY